MILKIKTINDWTCNVEGDLKCITEHDLETLRYKNFSTNNIEKLDNVWIEPYSIDTINKIVDLYVFR